MPHLDEGTLQAWLDRDRSGLGPEERGRIEAHLAECEACARSLEELRASTDRVEELLGASAAAEVVPPFADVQARAEAGPGREERTLRRRWRPTAWAASVAVALGVGWMANEMIRTGGVDGVAGSDPVARETADSGVGAGEAAVAELGPPSTGTAEPSRDRPRLPVARPAAPVVEEPAAVAQGTDPSAPSEVDDVSILPTTFEDRVAERPAPEAERMPAEQRAPGRDAAAVLRGRVTDASTGRPISGAQVYVADGAVGTLTDREGGFELAFADLPDDSAVTLRAVHLGYEGDSARIGLADAGAAAVDFRLDSEAVALDEIVVTGAVEQAEPGVQPGADPVPVRDSVLPLLRAADRTPWATAWGSVSLEEAEARAGFRPLRVPGLPVWRVRVGPMGGATWILVVQDHPDGGLLRLYQTPGRQDVEAILALEPGSGAGWVTRVVDGVQVIAGTGGAAGGVEALLDLLER